MKEKGQKGAGMVAWPERKKRLGGQKKKGGAREGKRAAWQIGSKKV